MDGLVLRQDWRSDGVFEPASSHSLPRKRHPFTVRLLREWPLMHTTD
jgi:hypothetical protein